MRHTPNTTEERLKELKETYARLFTGRGGDHTYLLPSEEYLWHYRRMVPNQGSGSRYTQDEKNNDGAYGKPLTTEVKIWQPSTAATPKLKLRPLLEDLNKRGPAEKRNFMLQRMDDLSANRPAKVMDYVRRQYPSPSYLLVEPVVTGCAGIIFKPTSKAVAHDIEKTASDDVLRPKGKLSNVMFASKGKIKTVDLQSHIRHFVNDDNTNTFFLLGDVHRCIRDYLTGNGWIEKYSGQEERAHVIRSLQGLPSQDSRTLGRVLATDPVKFIWVNGFINWSLISNSVIVSRIPSSSYYFSKTALASSIRDLFPFLYHRGLVDVQTPRTYEIRQPEDMRHFVKQYRINACISLMRRFHTALEPSSQIKLFSDDGTVPLDCIDFAIQRVVEVIRYHDHADIDEWHFSVVSDEDWNVFIFRFYDIVHQDAKFQIQHHNINIPAYANGGFVAVSDPFIHTVCERMQLARKLMENWCCEVGLSVNLSKTEMVLCKKESKKDGFVAPTLLWRHLRLINEVKFKLTHACEKLCIMFEKYFPDTKHDGYRNLWIVKPSNGSCGRGVRVIKRLVEIQQYCKPTNSYVIQKYIEDPLLIFNTKFDVRQWFLITSVYPLVIWMYDECYLRFCSQQFSLTNVHESVHLCNNSVQHKYKNGARSSQLPEDNMWDDKTFQAYLSEREGTSVWPVIKNKMRTAIIASCLVSQDKMYHRSNSFHLYGADFMITSDYDVWLIEINTHPSMKYSTSVTTRMCKEVLQDTLKVGLDRRANPHADTGKFVEIYRQQPHLPTVGVPASAAGVQARKIRLLNQAIPKETIPSKPFEDTSRTPARVNKWLTYPSIATYKKHNKVNFKYVVLRHTDMPLDPGDGITQRDIGYAGVLDKVSLTENIIDSNEEAKTSEEDLPEKEKQETPTVKVTPKSTPLHRKVIAKLKAKEKVSSEKEYAEEEDADLNSSKSLENTKAQYTNEAQNIEAESVTDVKKKIAPISNIDTESYRSKPMHEDIVHEVRSIPQLGKARALNSENPEKTVNSKKASSSFLNSTNKANQQKSANPKKNMNKENVSNSVKKENLNQVKNSENITDNETASNLKKVVNQAKPSQRKVPVKNKSKVGNSTKKENNSKPTILEDKKKRGSYVKNNKDYSIQSYTSGEEKKRKTGSVKNQNGSKTNYAKQNVDTKVIKKPSSTIEKIVSEKLRTESINFISISRKARETRSQLNTENSVIKETVTNTKRANIPRPKNKLIKQPTGQSKKQSTNKVNPSTDSTRINKLSNENWNVSKKENEKGDNPPRENERPEYDEEGMFIHKEDDSDAIILQQAFIPQQVIFMMSDSEGSFKTAVNASNDELLDEDSITSIYQAPVDSEDEPYSPPNMNLIKEERINTNSIKRYKNRNKYCE